MDDFLSQLNETDTRKKIATGEEIVKYLKNPDNSIECEDIGQFIDGLVPWMQNSNFKVSSNALEVMSCLVERMKEGLRPYLSSVFPPTIDRLGDTKDSVRNEARQVLSLIMNHVVPPNSAFQRLVPAFSHKNGRVREEVMLCLQNTLTSHGASSVTISRLLPHIVKLLSDSGAPVRDMALNTLVHAYRHYGDRMKADLNSSKYNLPQSKLTTLNGRFDEVKNSGLLLPSALGGEMNREEDETDRASIKSGGGSISSKAKVTTAKKPVTAVRNAAASSGSVDENYFFASYEDCPKLNIYSGKELEEQLSKIRDVIGNGSNDWDKRVEMLRRLRSVIVGGGLTFDEFPNQLRLLEPALTLSVKDLRSQVVREACVTVAYISQELKQKADHLCETVLPHIIPLVPNSVKIMATSGSVCMRFIIENTHHHRLIPIIVREITGNKSKEIRRYLLELLDQLVGTWPVHVMDKHSALIAEAIKKGISDADSDARAFARKAYWGYANHFKDESDKLLNSLEGSYRKMLQGEAGTMSTSTSSHSLQGTNNRSSSIASAPVSRRGSLRRIPSASSSTVKSTRQRDTVDSTPSLPARGVGIVRSGSSHIPSPSFRSTSAIDVNAARRAQARAMYANAHRMKAGSGVSLPRPRKSLDQSPHSSLSPYGRGASSQSQPGSRSGSPPRLSYTPGNSSTGPRSRRRSGIPRSTGTSRDPSPSRPRFGGPPPCLSSGMATPNARRRSGTEPHPMASRPRQLMAEKILQKSRECENALADALGNNALAAHGRVSPYGNRTPSRRVSREDHSEDGSETSSICSERSYDSYRRNDPHWFGSQQRFGKEDWDSNDQLQDIEEIILSCSSTHWGERKEGLLALKHFLRGSAMLTASQLRKVTEVFAKMFLDPHTKVFTLFLDTLMQLITVHSADLDDWLQVLLIKLFQKLGLDLLGSVQTKIHDTLDIVRTSFDPVHQYQVIMRFITDPTQTPNSKVKLASLTYLRCVLDAMDRGDITASPDVTAAVVKILSWTTDQRSVELRRASSACFIAMFNCNMTAFTTIMKQLPPSCQNVASTIIQNHLKRAASLDQSPSSLPISALSTPGLQSPTSSLPRHKPVRLSSTDATDGAAAMAVSSEDVFRNIKKTTDEIRNYSFDNTSKGEQKRDSSSQDSGISQVSVNGATGVTTQPEDASSNGDVAHSFTRPVLLSKPSLEDNGLIDLTNELGDLTIESEEDSKAIVSVLATLGSQSDVEERKSALHTLVRLAQTGSTLVWNENFRSVLRVLVANLSSGSGYERALVLTVVSEMLKRSPLVSLFLNYSELIILRVLKAHGDEEKQVIRAAQLCAATVAEILPPDVVIRVLKPLVQMGDFPDNQSAIKMLNKLVEAHPAVTVAQTLPDVMPGLVKACDDKDSSVRKASVCCMVAIHNRVGDETLKPYLEQLSGSKLKLLNLYIKRSSSKDNSGTSSPKSEPI